MACFLLPYQLFSNDGTRNITQGHTISSGKTITVADPTFEESPGDKLPDALMMQDLVESVEAPSKRKSKLRADIAGEGETVQGSTDGNRALQHVATVELINNCGSDVNAYTIYEHSDASYTSAMSEFSDGGSVFFSDVSDPTIWIYGIDASSSGKIWTSTNSPLCIDDGDCFLEIDLGSLASGNVQYEMCGDRGSPLTPPTSGEADEWLSEHNTRRTQFFAENGLGPLDLKWADSLAASAQNYANTLIGRSGCSISHGYNGDNYGGENLAANWGSGSYAKARSIPEVMTAWYDEEMKLPGLYDKLHATQVVWRSSYYLGCGQAEKDMGGGQSCFIQVCRYVANGNCFLDQDNWMHSVLHRDVSIRLCAGDQCDSLAEGCF